MTRAQSNVSLCLPFTWFSYGFLSHVRDAFVAPFSWWSPLLLISPVPAEMSGWKSCMEKLNSIVQRKFPGSAFTGWRKIYNQSKSGFLAKRQIFPPLQPWEILNIVEGKQFCCTGWGKEEQEAVSKRPPHFFALHSKAGSPCAGRTLRRLQVCNRRRSWPGPVTSNHTNCWAPESQRCQPVHTTKGMTSRAKSAGAHSLLGWRLG